MEIRNERKRPKLTLVGAGPGDPELLTLKAVNVLREADVVLYDALANVQILDFCHPLCEKIYVGKLGHVKGIIQESINQLIIEKAYEKGHVVRLKGGDPFVFGRGIEEAEFAHERGVEVDYVPGISSIFSGGNHFIPLTDRRLSDGFWVLTGHKSDKSFSSDLELAVKSNSTLVLLMAMSKLAHISNVFYKNEKENEDFCIIQNANTPIERKLFGKIKEIENLAREGEYSNPSIIIIGKVVNYSAKFNKIIKEKNVFEWQKK